MQNDRQLGEALHEARLHPNRCTDDLDLAVALHDLLPEYTQLQLRQSTPHAEVHAQSKGEVLLRVIAVDQELVRPQILEVIL